MKIAFFNQSRPTAWDVRPDAGICRLAAFCDFRGQRSPETGGAWKRSVGASTVDGHPVWHEPSLHNRVLFNRFDFF